MGQAKRRGTFDQRLEQANSANESLKKTLLDNAQDIKEFSSLSEQMEKHGVQKFRMMLKHHVKTDSKAVSPS